MFGFSNYYEQLERSMSLRQSYLKILEYKRNEIREKFSDLFDKEGKIITKECIKCGICCWQRPCSLDKNDVKNISEFLNITIKELFKNYLLVDKFESFCVLPRRHSQKDIAGKYIPAHRTFDIVSPCVFLNKNNKCRIYEVRPIGACMCECWKDIPDSIIEWSKEDLINIGWDGKIVNEEEENEEEEE